ncbi:MAG: hypothetical protein HY226_04000 [Candidatus Vogelbacteria bacterium]|nr:hypothetical protein [Candidatus Vogelbacteria bacterium]
MSRTWRHKKNKVKVKRPVCGVCLHPEFTVAKACDGRPQFNCTKCYNLWTSGRDGGTYIKSKFAKFVKEKEADEKHGAE